MKLTTKQILIYIMLGLFTACGKKITLKVSAKNPVTEEPYPNLSFVVYRSTGISDAFGNKYKTVYAGELGDNGEAIIEIREKNNKGYYVSMKGPDDVCYRNHNEIAFSNPTIVGNHFNYEFVPCAHLKLIINNVNCEGEGDSLILYQGNQINSFNFETPWLHKGCVYWETSGGGTGYSNIPMGEQYYKWEVTRSGITETFTDTIYLEAGEYRTYEINY